MSYQDTILPTALGIMEASWEQPQQPILLLYGYYVPPFGGTELFEAKVICTDEADQQRQYRNYQRQIARNGTRKRRTNQVITGVEMTHE